MNAVAIEKSRLEQLKDRRQLIRAQIERKTLERGKGETVLRRQRERLEKLQEQKAADDRARVRAAAASWAVDSSSESSSVTLFGVTQAQLDEAARDVASIEQAIKEVDAAVSALGVDLYKADAAVTEEATRIDNEFIEKQKRELNRIIIEVLIPFASIIPPRDEMNLPLNELRGPRPMLYRVLDALAVDRGNCMHDSIAPVGSGPVVESRNRRLAVLCGD